MGLSVSMTKVLDRIRAIRNDRPTVRRKTLMHTTWDASEEFIAVHKRWELTDIDLA